MKVLYNWIKEGREVKIDVKDAELLPNRPLYFKADILKQPADSIKSGMIIGDGVRVDKKTPLRRLTDKAKELRNENEEVRVSFLIRLVRGKLSFPYQSRIENEKPEVKKWIKTNISSADSSVDMSDCLDKGYGVCRHFAVLFAVLAQAAGLKVVIEKCSEGTLINVPRADTIQLLFRSIPSGKVQVSHMWNEVLVNGKWIPVDTTTNLNGFIQSQMNVFSKADYRHNDLNIIVEESRRDIRALPVLDCPVGLGLGKLKMKVQAIKRIGRESKSSKVALVKTISKKFKGNFSLLVKCVGRSIRFRVANIEPLLKAP